LILSRVVRRVGEVIEEGRSALEDLRSPVFHDNTLEEALVRAVDELAAGDSIRPTVTISGIPQSLNSVVRQEAYHIGREALNNALRHAAATAIDIEIVYSPHTLLLRVQDDGRGNDDISKTAPAGHWGMIGMRERADHIGAHLKVSSRSGAGTTIELTVPARTAYTVYTRTLAFSGKRKRRSLWARAAALLRHFND
jgi:signal transduction histidine kinase